MGGMGVMEDARPRCHSRFGRRGGRRGVIRLAEGEVEPLIALFDGQPGDAARCQIVDKGAQAGE
ncbi:MAG: hypothetical protein CMN19_07505 [Roseovarius sp.]|nr:hypothetical protein [Roseovarius sp.]